MSADWPDSRSSWQGRRMELTGDAGFLGRFLVKTPSTHGALVQLEAVQALLADARPEVLIHLAARVVGIGANWEHPAEFFYEKLLMGVQLLYGAWRVGPAVYSLLVSRWWRIAEAMQLERYALGRLRAWQMTVGRV